MNISKSQLFFLIYSSVSIVLVLYMMFTIPGAFAQTTTTIPTIYGTGSNCPPLGACNCPNGTTCPIVQVNGCPQYQSCPTLQVPSGTTTNTSNPNANIPYIGTSLPQTRGLLGFILDKPVGLSIFNFDITWRMVVLLIFLVIIIFFVFTHLAMAIFLAIFWIILTFA